MKIVLKTKYKLKNTVEDSKNTNANLIQHGCVLITLMIRNTELRRH